MLELPYCNKMKIKNAREGVYLHENSLTKISRLFPNFGNSLTVQVFHFPGLLQTPEKKVMLPKCEPNEASEKMSTVTHNSRPQASINCRSPFTNFMFGCSTYLNLWPWDQGWRPNHRISTGHKIYEIWRQKFNYCWRGFQIPASFP